MLKDLVTKILSQAACNLVESKFTVETVWHDYTAYMSVQLSYLLMCFSCFAHALRQFATCKLCIAMYLSSYALPGTSQAC